LQPATRYHKRERKLESNRKIEEVKEKRLHREGLKAKIALKIKRIYAYYPDIHLNARYNAFHILNVMPLDLLLLQPHNLAYHNLRKPNNDFPSTIKSFLGLGEWIHPDPDIQ